MMTIEERIHEIDETFSLYFPVAVGEEALSPCCLLCEGPFEEGNPGNWQGLCPACVLEVAAFMQAHLVSRRVALDIIRGRTLRTRQPALPSPPTLPPPLPEPGC